MFLASRPSDELIQDFLRHSHTLPLSYQPVGLGDNAAAGFRVDEASGPLGFGQATLNLAKRALCKWRHFDLGWVELYPAGAEIKQGTVVAVLVRHLGFWSLNGCRVLQVTGDREMGPLFGFTYGTLTNHAEMGEELFEVTMNSETFEVSYRIRALSKPRAALAQLGYPITRALQSRFRRDSIAAMQRALKIPGLR
jgi:uncharacterized protein (UPF0548 family)